MSSEEYESILIVKQEVLVYKIPPRPSARGYKAQDWNLEVPDWTGRLKISSKGKLAIMRFEDKESGKLYAQCVIETFPSAAIEAVLDSSRFFVARITDETGSRTAFIGMGFRDRADSFDMNVALQDHFKWLRNEQEAKASQEQEAKAASANPASAGPPAPKLQLGFKEGESITIKMGNLKVKEKGDKSSGGFGAGGALLPPPPAPGSRVQQVRPASGATPAMTSTTAASSLKTNGAQQPAAADDLLGLDLLGGAPSSISSQPVSTSQSKPAPSGGGQPWIEF